MISFARDVDGARHVVYVAGYHDARQIELPQQGGRSPNLVGLAVDRHLGAHTARVGLVSRQQVDAGGLSERNGATQRFAVQSDDDRAAGRRLGGGW